MRRHLGKDRTDGKPASIRGAEFWMCRNQAFEQILALSRRIPMYLLASEVRKRQCYFTAVRFNLDLLPSSSWERAVYGDFRVSTILIARASCAMLSGFDDRECQMNEGKTLFAQVMEIVPWKTFGRIIERHKGECLFVRSGVPTCFASWPSLNSPGASLCAT